MSANPSNLFGIGQQQRGPEVRCETCKCIVAKWGVLYQPTVEVCRCVRVQRIVDKRKWRD